MRFIVLLLSLPVLSACDMLRQPPGEVIPAPVSASAQPVVGAEAAAAFDAATEPLRPVIGDMFSAMDALN